VRSAVIGRAAEDVDGGEEIIAFVQTAPGSPLTAAQMGDHASQYLAPYKRPTRILLVPEIPLTLTGKVVKEELAKTLVKT
jgi:acyl-coenzyme A synthetase/AMP-(fatty) acid ligase